MVFSTFINNRFICQNIRRIEFKEEDKWVQRDTVKSFFNVLKGTYNMHWYTILCWNCMPYDCGWSCFRICGLDFRLDFNRFPPFDPVSRSLGACWRLSNSFTAPAGWYLGPCFRNKPFFFQLGLYFPNSQNLILNWYPLQLNSLKVY